MSIPSKRPSINAEALVSMSVPISSDLQGLNEIQKNKLEIKIKLLSQKTLLRVYVPKDTEVEAFKKRVTEHSYYRNLHHWVYYNPITSKALKIKS